MRSRELNIEGEPVVASEWEGEGGDVDEGAVEVEATGAVGVGGAGAGALDEGRVAEALLALR